MADTNCPICYAALSTRETAPCMDCGASEAGLAERLTATYTEYELYFKQRLILCSFCAVDFGSYQPAYFGFPGNRKIGFPDFSFVRSVSDRSLRIDKYCPECRKRLPFLKFVRYCRDNSLIANT